MEWLDWLHKSRAESEAERKRTGASIAERLERSEESADRVQALLAGATSPVASDRKPTR
jgi:hypothetical protein